MFLCWESLEVLLYVMPHDGYEYAGNFPIWQLYLLDNVICRNPSI